MFPAEVVILMALVISKDTGKTLTHRMDITGEYIGYLYDSLVRRGYLRGNRSIGYQLTLMGRGTLVKFLHKNGNRAEDIIKRLQQLDIEIGQQVERKIGKLEKKAIKVN